MKKILVCFAVLATMILMISCGGSDDEWGKPCKEDVALYYCEDGHSSVENRCVKGASAYMHCYNPNTDKYEYSSSCFSTRCHSGCDENTGRCIAECIEGQYKCDEYIYSCDKEGQWQKVGINKDPDNHIFNSYCIYGCAKELSTSISDICADHEEE